MVQPLLTRKPLPVRLYIKKHHEDSEPQATALSQPGVFLHVSEEMSRTAKPSVNSDLYKMGKAREPGKNPDPTPSRAPPFLWWISFHQEGKQVWATMAFFILQR